MYEAFYGLNQKPFSLTPDPHFLYQSERHREIFESILYGIDRREGFMVVTGDIGTGKTTLCRALMKRLPPQVRTAVVLNSFVTEAGLLSSILEDFGSPVRARTKKDRIDALNRFLIDLLSNGENAVLIIDEAQNLSIPVMEQLRMLSNLETEKEKMLQIVLLGQPELQKKLQSCRLKQLNQRVSIRCRLLPLTRKETEAYVTQRLARAGSDGGVTFSKAALDEIYRRSGGIPRLINLLSDRALMAGFVDQIRRIDRSQVRRGSRSLLGMEEEPARLPFLGWPNRVRSWAISALCLVLLLWVGMVRSDSAKEAPRPKGRDCSTALSPSTGSGPRAMSRGVLKDFPVRYSHYIVPLDPWGTSGARSGHLEETGRPSESGKLDLGGSRR